MLQDKADIVPLVIASPAGAAGPRPVHRHRRLHEWAAIDGADFSLSGGCFPIFSICVYQIYVILYDF